MENGNQQFIISIERFKPHTYRLEQGEGFFMSHSHEYDELTLVLEGEGYYSSPQQNIKVTAGDMIVIPPGLHHGFVSTTPWQGVSVHYRQEHLPVQSQYLFHRSEQEGERIYHTHLSIKDKSPTRRTNGPSTARCCKQAASCILSGPAGKATRMCGKICISHI